MNLEHFGTSLTHQIKNKRDLAGQKGSSKKSAVHLAFLVLRVLLLRVLLKSH